MITLVRAFLFFSVVSSSVYPMQGYENCSVYDDKNCKTCGYENCFTVDLESKEFDYVNNQIDSLLLNVVLNASCEELKIDRGDVQVDIQHKLLCSSITQALNDVLNFNFHALEESNPDLEILFHEVVDLLEKGFASHNCWSMSKELGYWKPVKSLECWQQLQIDWIMQDTHLEEDQNILKKLRLDLLEALEILKKNFFDCQGKPHNMSLLILTLKEKYKE